MNLRYVEVVADMKWAIQAVASARCAFNSSAYIDRFTEIENELISLRNEIKDLAGIKR